jgi:hypothetical protein
MPKSAFFTFTFIEVSITSVLESHVRRYLELLPSISKDRTLVSDKTIGRTLRLCGEIGVTTMFPDPGKTIGPPQLSEYAVEPVGVATISPSAQ